jgi:dipeptidyl aminopeptidase/acylaminoacyl peptidase
MLRFVLGTMLSVSMMGAMVNSATGQQKEAAKQESSPSAQAPQEQAGSVPLIPRAVLFGNPDKAGPQISPDGTRLAYLAEVDGVLNVYVGPIDDLSKAKAVTADKKRGIRSYFWAYNNRHVLYIQDKDGDENWHVYAVDLKSGETRDLTPIPGVQARIEEVSYKFPNDILVGLNDRDPRLHDVYRVNIESGERKLTQKNEGDFVAFVADDDFNVRVAQKTTADGGGELFVPATEGTEWVSFLKITPDDAMTTSPAGFDKAGKVLYMIDSIGRDTSAMVALEMASKEKKVIASNPKADVSGAMIHPTEKNIQAVSFTYERREWNILDDTIKPDFEYLKTVTPGEVNVLSRTLDDKHWIVGYVLDDGPARYYDYDRAAKKARFLFTNRKALEGLKLSKMHPVVIKSRDGMELVSYLTLPVWEDKDGKPGKPLPMVLDVHGGPWARDGWGYNGYAQWLANRGYAVLSVNFRGSTGFGKKFINAANLQWAGTMHNDLIDAVNWAVKEKIADPQKVAIMGGSYGGYATLVGLTFTPEVFACGVDIVGPSSLLTLLESVPPYWKPMLEMFTTRIGDHRTEEGRKLLTERSPLTFVDKIKRPLLIGQGANDPRVKKAEADQIVAKMEEKKIPVTYLLMTDEGHGFARPENNKAFNAATEAFLSKMLGGRFEPIGKDFEGSSITVVKGADGVPGLAEVISAKPKATEAAPAEPQPQGQAKP